MGDAAPIEHLAFGSVDLVIDSAPQDTVGKEYAFNRYCRLVKPGGFYVIEKLNYARGAQIYAYFRDELDSSTRYSTDRHHIFLVDASLGHRAWAQWQ